MAIYHLSAKAIGRSQGRSSTAAAAYRAGVRITDERTGLVFDFRRKRGVDGSEIFTPDGSQPERGALWNAVEKVEKRADAQLAREVEIALPRELNGLQLMLTKRRIERGSASKPPWTYTTRVTSAMHGCAKITGHSGRGDEGRGRSSGRRCKAP